MRSEPAAAELLFRLSRIPTMNPSTLTRGIGGMSRLTLVTGLYSLLLIGCGKDAPPPESPPVTTKPYELQQEGEADPIASPDAQKGGTFTTWAGGYPKSLNMWLDYNAFSKSISELMYEGLLGLHTTENRPVGNLAESWKISDDLKTYTFKIKGDAYWSDGKPITSRDFQFYYDTIMNPENLTSLFRVSLSRFDRPEIIDDKNFSITANTSHWRNFWDAGSLVAFPTHSWEGKDFNQINFDFEVVSGPYQVYEIKTNRSIMLQRRGDWWGRNQRFNQGKYNFDYLRFRAMEDRVKALELLKRGDFDMYAIYTSRIWAQQTHFPQVKKNWVIRQTVYNHEPKAFQGFAINMRRPQFQDVRVRKALAHLLNREMMLEKIMFNEYFLLNSYYPDLYPNNKNPEVPLLQYDPGKARDLLAEAGYQVNDRGQLEKDGVPLEVVILYHGTPIPQLTIYIEDMKKVGIEASIDTVSYASFVKRMDNQEFDLAWRNWSAARLRDPEPMWHSKTAHQVASQNLSGVENKEIDALIEQQKTEMDLDTRNEILKKIDSILCKIHPYVLLWQSDRNRLLYWNRYGTPEYVLDKYNREDYTPIYWWYDSEKDALLKEAMRTNSDLASEPAEIHYR
jgi:microcin C transport system substrate-binding protein